MNKLYILCGIPFSGKTTLGKFLAQKFGHIRINLDDIKFELFSTDKKDREMEKKDWDIVYQTMYMRIYDALKSGKTVIHDTGNFTKHEREHVRQIADTLGVKTVTVFVDTPKEVARERLVNNRSTNQRFDVDQKDFDSTVQEMEPPTADENPLIFHHNESLNEWMKKNC